MKATAEACANQGLIKYWGKTDEKLRLPTNDSISCCLEALRTRTTVEFSERYATDSFVLNGTPTQDPRVVGHLDLMRSLGGSRLKARVESRNGFPASAGYASSASGFAALTLAGATALGLGLSEAELSRLARRGSGSASRSIPGGFAELVAGADDAHTFARGLAGPDDLDFRTVVVTVGAEAKKVSSREGMRITAETSPLFPARIGYLPGMLAAMRSALAKKEAARVAHLAETDTMNMHACMITSEPPLLYWAPGTIEVIRAVASFRDEGVVGYVSIDAGQNVFVNTTSRHAGTLEERLRSLPGVSQVLLSRPGGPARTTDEHLF